MSGNKPHEHEHRRMRIPVEEGRKERLHPVPPREGRHLDKKQVDAPIHKLQGVAGLMPPAARIMGLSIHADANTKFEPCSRPPRRGEEPDCSAEGESRAGEEEEEEEGNKKAWSLTRRTDFSTSHKMTIAATAAPPSIAEDAPPSIAERGEERQPNAAA